MKGSPLHLIFLMIAIAIGLDIVLFALLALTLEPLYSFLSTLNVVWGIVSIITAAAIFKYLKQLSNAINIIFHYRFKSMYKVSTKNISSGMLILTINYLGGIIALWVLAAKWDRVMIIELLYLTGLIYLFSDTFMPKVKFFVERNIRVEM